MRYRMPAFSSGSRFLLFINYHVCGILGSVIRRQLFSRAAQKENGVAANGFLVFFFIIKNILELGSNGYCTVSWIRWKSLTYNLNWCILGG